MFLKARYGDNTGHSHYRTHKGHFNWWCKRIGEYRLSQITPQSLIKYREELLKSVTPTTCQRYLASLSGAFTWAMRDERQWVSSNPVRLVTKGDLEDAECHQKTGPLFASRPWDANENIRLGDEVALLPSRV